VASYAFLALALAFGLLTLNAHFPIRSSRVLLFPSFVAAWINSELAVQHLLLQVAAVLVFVPPGTLETWPGRVALGVTALSWLGMVPLAVTSRRSGTVLEQALGECCTTHGLTAAAVARARERLFVPFSKSDRGVKVHLDVRYAEGHGTRHLLDVYRSEAPRTKAPVLLQIHGGGWFTGHKRQQAVPLMLHMVRCGFVCVSANYRLSPRATFPQHLEDVKRALAWVRAHIEEYGGDPDWIAITGGSAGAHLCALAALTPGDPEYQPGFEEVDTRVRACVPFYGVYDFTDRHRHQRHDGMQRLVSRWVLKKDPTREPEAFERASPMAHVGPHAPAFFVIHGTHDNLVPVAEARAFVRLLRERSRQPVAYAELPGAHHAFEIFHSMRTARVVQAVASFLTTIHARDLAARGASASVIGLVGLLTASLAAWPCGGRVVGAYGYGLHPEERATVATFTLR
jgi:acetyl esterase/lipase